LSDGLDEQDGQFDRDEDARTDYTDELMPALERVAHDRRMLFIQVDT
jgi:hypothetical protein